MVESTLSTDGRNLRLRSGAVVRNHVNGHRYRVWDLLGRGGFGCAYRISELRRAAHSGSGEYCLKITASPEGWYREAYFGHLLRNVAGVIQVYEAFAWVPDGRKRVPLYCLVTELAAGGDLASWFERNPGAWKEATARREIIRLLHTIGRLHERGAVHRDMTPLNVFVTSDQSLKVGDFGIAAHPLGKGHVAVDAFARWLAPPGIADGKMFTWRPADDVYHLGQLFAMLLRGSAESRLTARDVKKLQCSAASKSVIQRCIVGRRKRFKNAATMLAALERQVPQRKVIVRSLEGRRVVFTGRLAIPRTEATRMVRRAGGVVQRRVCHSTDILVVGKTSPSWKADTKGQKLLDLDLENELNHRIARISERRFMNLIG